MEIRIASLTIAGNIIFLVPIAGSLIYNPFRQPEVSYQYFSCHDSMLMLFFQFAKAVIIMLLAFLYGCISFHQRLEI